MSLTDNIEENKYSVKVKIIQTLPDEKKSLELSKLFDASYFDIEFVNNTVKIPDSTGRLSKSDYVDNVTIKAILEQYVEQHKITKTTTQDELNKMLPILIIKDTSIPSPESTSVNIKATIRKTFMVKNEFDIFYLCKWLDDCSKHTKIDTKLKYLVRTQNPHGLQALILTPKCIMKSLNITPLEVPVSFEESLDKEICRLIAKDQLVTLATKPNLFNFDISLAESNNEYYKVSECATNFAETSSNDSNTTSTSYNSAGWVFFIAIVIIVLIIAFALIVLAPRRK